MSSISPEFALLGFLIAGPGYGYDLHQKFQTELGRVWRLSQSQAYAILKRLEARGDISSRQVDQEKLPARQILNITASGEKRFEEWLLEAGHNARTIRLEFLTRLYFASIHYPDKMDQIYTLQFAKILTGIKQLESMLDQLPQDQPFNRLSLDLRLRQLRLILEWMHEIRVLFDIPNVDRL